MLAGSHGPCLSIRLSGEFGFGLHEPLGEESPGGGGGQHNQDVDSAVDADGQHDQGSGSRMRRTLRWCPVNDLVAILTVPAIYSMGLSF